MKIIIKNRWTEEVIIEGGAENIKEFLEKNRSADLYGADLYGANLRGANLYSADLRGADLRDARIKITQKDELLKALRINIEE